MGKIYNNNITTHAGFNYPAQQPLDDRDVVQSYADLADLVNSHLTYEGMEVYVLDDQKSYKLIGEAWKPMATEEYVGTQIGNIQENVNPDWNQTDATQPNYIQNKPIADATLTVSGGFADAKTVGDIFDNIKSGEEQYADYHLGFYLDENGDLNQVD